jgi:hypothetical protein
VLAAILKLHERIPWWAYVVACVGLYLLGLLCMVGAFVLHSYASLRAGELFTLAWSALLASVGVLAAVHTVTRRQSWPRKLLFLGVAAVLCVPGFAWLRSF